MAEKIARKTPFLPKIARALKNPDRSVSLVLMSPQEGEASRHREGSKVLVRFALERLLYRLSRSEHSDRFLLKGALFLLL